MKENKKGGDSSRVFHISQRRDDDISISSVRSLVLYARPLQGLNKVWNGGPANHSEQDLAVLRCSGLKPAPAPLTPDHVVYSGVEPLDLDDGQSLAAYRARFGDDPRLVLCEGALYAIGAASSLARAACDLAADGAEIMRLTEAFGGARFMSEEQWHFVVNWEAEVYRHSVAMGD